LDENELVSARRLSEGAIFVLPRPTTFSLSNEAFALAAVRQWRSVRGWIALLNVATELHP
jgi:hypothetical protein